MKTIKSASITLVVFIVLMLASIIYVAIGDQYVYSDLDLTQEKNKLALADEVELEITPFGETNSLEIRFELFNLTEQRLEDIAITMVLKDDNGNITHVNSKNRVGLVSRDAVEFKMTGELDGTTYKFEEAIATIGDGEEFTLNPIESMVKENNMITIASFAFVILLVIVISHSIRLNKMIKDKAAAEVRQELLRNATLVNDEIVVNGNTNTAPNAQPLESALAQSYLSENYNLPQQEDHKTITCEYCSAENDPSQTKCSVCGAHLKK